MPHIWKSCTTKLAKNTDGYKIRLQSVGRNSISGWRVNFIPIRRNTRTGRGGFGPCARAHRVCTPPQPRTCQHGVQKSGRTVLRFRFAAGRRGKIVPFGRLFERFATSLFELSISWQISAFPYSYFIFPSYPFSLFFSPSLAPLPPPPPLLSRPRSCPVIDSISNAEIPFLFARAIFSPFCEWRDLIYRDVGENRWREFSREFCLF